MWLHPSCHTQGSNSVHEEKANKRYMWGIWKQRTQISHNDIELNRIISADYSPREDILWGRVGLMNENVVSIMYWMNKYIISSATWKDGVWTEPCHLRLQHALYSLYMFIMSWHVTYYYVHKKIRTQWIQEYKNK